MTAKEERRKAKNIERERFIEWMCSERYEQCSNKIHTKGCCV